MHYIVLLGSSQTGKTPHEKCTENHQEIEKWEDKMYAALLESEQDMGEKSR